MGPAVVLDFTKQVAENNDYLVTIDDIKQWESQHGALPDNAWVLLRTGWDKFSDDREAFLNIDETGSHTPWYHRRSSQVAC